MDYSFRNNAHDPETNVKLREYEMVVSARDHETVIPYASIIEVRLGRSKDSYFIHIITLDHGSLFITNQSFNYQGEWVIQSRSYLTFVRVLHFHLSEKSNATFYSGHSFSELLPRVAALTAFAVILFFTLQYLGIPNFQSIIYALGVLLIGGYVFLGNRIFHWPRTYPPTDIPLKFLPPAA